MTIFLDELFVKDSKLLFDIGNQMADVIKPSSLASEKMRQYHFGDKIVSIHDPKDLYCRPGGTTHRVVAGNGLVYIVPAPGRDGCYIVVTPKDPANPVQF